MSKTINDVPWDKEDIEILKNNYIFKTNKEIIPLLSIKRTPRAITHMASKLELRKTKKYDSSIKKEDIYQNIDGILHKMCKSCGRYLPLTFLYYPRDPLCKDGFRNICKECKGENFRNCLVFTQKDEDIIKQYYAIKTNREIQREFMPDKTLDQINHKASILGLKKDKETMTKARKEYMTEEYKKEMSKRVKASS